MSSLAKYSLLLLSLFWLLSMSMQAQSLRNLSFGTDATLDVATWNIERFAKNGQTTVDSVAQIIEALELDVLALQEIDDENLFNQLVSSLDGYEGMLEPGSFRGLAYIYKTDSTTVTDSYEIYQTSQFSSPFPRAPFVLEISFRGIDYVLINNHLKCCGNGSLEQSNPNDEETRRLFASQFLKQYIESDHPKDNVILLGDLNDLLTDSRNNNVFIDFIEEPENYRFADLPIAVGPSADWSFPSWPSHLDHILITNELFDDLEADNSTVETIRIDDYLAGGLNAYDANISDHRPVAMRLQPVVDIVGINTVTKPAPDFQVYPNPSTNQFQFEIQSQEAATLWIYDLHGRLIDRFTMQASQSQINWSAADLPTGIYTARLVLESGSSSSQKLVLLR